MATDQPDRRALHVARAIIFLARDWHLGHLVPAGAADLCARFLYSYSPREVHRISRAQSPSFRQLLSAFEYLTTPGMALHYALRKLAIEALVRADIAAGVQQVVVLAAGFDTLALRLHREYAQVRFIEIDRAVHQTIKRRALLGKWAAGKNLEFVAADLAREPLAQWLLDCGYVSGAPTTFVAETTLDTIGNEQRTAILEAIRVVGGPGCSVIFTAMERGPDGHIQFRGATGPARLWWRMQGMRFEWGPSRAELENYLHQRGFALAKVLGAKDFRVHYLDGDQDVPLAEGEAVAVAHVVKT